MSQTFQRRTRLSLEQLQKLVSEEWERNNTDLLSKGEDDTGRTAAQIIQDDVKGAARARTRRTSCPRWRRIPHASGCATVWCLKR